MAFLFAYCLYLQISASMSQQMVPQHKQEVQDAQNVQNLLLKVMPELRLIIQNYQVQSMAEVSATKLELEAMKATLGNVSFPDDVFTPDSRYSDSLPKITTLWHVVTADKRGCVMRCIVDENCVAFFSNQTHCYGLSWRMHDNVPTDDIPGMRYYEFKCKYGNVAERKPSKQSSTWYADYDVYDYTAGKANNGGRIPNALFPGESCSNTNYSNPIWWQVDLQDTYSVAIVSILSRNDSTHEIAIADILVGVGDQDGGPFTTCGNSTEPWVGEFRDYKCSPQPISGRFVRVSTWRPIDYPLTLCEVEVYAV